MKKITLLNLRLTTLLTILLMTLLSSFTFAEERFVGEFMNSGYYAEVDNITLTPEYLVTNITVKKPFYNKFIKETVRFYREEKKYEILKREIYQYSPPELIEKEKVANAALPLADGSPYGKVMEFVIGWQTKTEYDI